MKTYYQNITAILFIVILSLLVFTYGLHLRFGYGHIFVMIGGMYGIYTNMKAIMKERNPSA